MDGTPTICFSADYHDNRLLAIISSSLISWQSLHSIAEASSDISIFSPCIPETGLMQLVQ